MTASLARRRLTFRRVRRRSKGVAQETGNYHPRAEDFLAGGDGILTPCGIKEDGKDDGWDLLGIKRSTHCCQMR